MAQIVLNTTNFDWNLLKKYKIDVNFYNFWLKCEFFWVLVNRGGQW